MLEQDAPLHHLLEGGALHGGLTQGRAQFHDIRFRKFPEPAFHRAAHNLDGEAMAAHQLQPLVKLPVGGQNDTEQMLDERGGGAGVLVPAGLAGLQYVIMQILKESPGSSVYPGDSFSIHPCTDARDCLRALCFSLP